MGKPVPDADYALDVDRPFGHGPAGANDHSASTRQVELVGSDPRRPRPPARAAWRTRLAEDRQVHTPEENPPRSRPLLPFASHSPDARGNRVFARQAVGG